MTDDGGIEPSRWWPQAERLADAAYPQQIESALKRAFQQGKDDVHEVCDALKAEIVRLESELDETAVQRDEWKDLAERLLVEKGVAVAGEDAMVKVDIREYPSLVREDVRAALITLKIQARQIWGDDKLTLTQIAALLTVSVGDLMALTLDSGVAASLTGMRMDDDVIVEIKRALGSVLFSTIRWIDDLGLDPLECLDLAIETDEKAVKSGRPR